MSHITVAQQGIAAAEAKKWDEAVDKLSIAVQASPNPGWLLVRSKAFINLQRYDEALDDANLAFHVAFERGKRPLMVDAHYRRAVAYYRKGQLANADCCCRYAMRLVKGYPAVEKVDPATKWTDERGFYTATLAEAKEEAQTDEVNKAQEGGIDAAMSGKGPAQAKEWRMASTLRMQILYAMEKLPEDAEARKLTTSLKPEKKELAKPSATKTDSKRGEKKVAATPSQTATTEQPAPKPVVPKGTPLRLQEFQTNTVMTVSIFSKGVNKDKLKVNFEPGSVTLEPLVYPSGEEKGFELKLWSEIDTTASKFTVTPNKVELSLVKKIPGKWAQLKKSEEESSATQSPSDSKTQSTAQTNDALSATKHTSTIPLTEQNAGNSEVSKGKQVAHGPAHTYPSSSRRGEKNWDKVDTEGSDDEGTGVDTFFKKLYKNATPEQQRAMMKSFTESNGTTLSTDWGDVGNRTVDTAPPEGVEAKKWDK